jgi:type I restriction enzyme R subunit
MIYDFFRNHQYFKDSDEDFFAEKGTGSSSGGSGGGRGPRPPRELIELGIGDRWKEAVQHVEIVNDGEQLDKRRYVSIWEEMINNQVADDPILQKIRAGEFLTEEEETQLEQQLNQPRYYFNEENLRRAYNSQQSNLIDFIKAALKLVRIKILAEQKEEIFRAWLISKSFLPEQAQYLSLLKNRGIAKGKLDLADLFQPPLSVLNAAGLGIELFGEQGLRDLFEDLNCSVFLNDVTEMAG